MLPNLILKYVKLPCYFDASLLSKEVMKIEASWVDHYNSYNYTGNWKAIPLRSKGGKTDEIKAESSEGFKDTPILKDCTYISEIIHSLPGKKLSARLLNLHSGSVIKEHRDMDLSFEKGEARLHIPVITHEDVEFFIDGEQVKMLGGECWYINANLPHRVSNLSPVNRIHLVIDLLVDDEVENFFAGADENYVGKKEDHEAIQMMEKTINELLLSPDENMQALGKKLQQEHLLDTRWS